VCVYIYIYQGAFLCIINKQLIHVTILSGTPAAAHLQHSHEDELSWNIIPMMINELQFESYKTVINIHGTGENLIQSSRLENLKERYHLDGLGTEEGILYGS